MSYWKDIPDDVFFSIPLYKTGKTGYREYVKQSIDFYIEKKKRKRERKRERRLAWIEHWIKTIFSYFKDIDGSEVSYCNFYRACTRAIGSLKLRFVNIKEYSCWNLRNLRITRRYRDMPYNVFVRKRAHILHEAMKIKLGREWAKFSNPKWFK